jgi:hypothetical protein
MSGPYSCQTRDVITAHGTKRPHFCSKIGRNQGVIACFRKEASHQQGVSFSLRQAARALFSGKVKGQRGAPQGAPLLGHER